MFTQRWHRYGVFQRLEWISNETLQLQRMAHEELGCGTWTGAEKTVPVTANNETLALLNVEDQAHPSLARTEPVAVQKEDKSETEHSDLQKKECELPTSRRIDGCDMNANDGSRNDYARRELCKEASSAVARLVGSTTTSEASTSPIESRH